MKNKELFHIILENIPLIPGLDNSVLCKNFFLSSTYTKKDHVKKINFLHTSIVKKWNDRIMKKILTAV